MFLIFHKESPVSFARKQTQGRHQSWPLWEPSIYSPLSRSTLLIPVFNIFRPCRIVCVTSIILYNIIIVHIYIWEKNTGKGEEEERDMEIEHFDHKHLLWRMYMTRYDLIRCKACSSLCDGRAYVCGRLFCNYALHESCAKLPKMIQSPYHTDHHFFYSEVTFSPVATAMVVAIKAAASSSAATTTSANSTLILTALLRSL